MSCISNKNFQSNTDEHLNKGCLGDKAPFLPLFYNKENNHIVDFYTPPSKDSILGEVDIPLSGGIS